MTGSGPAAARFIVEVPHVKEVSLVAAADLADWQARLGPERLYPCAVNGAAEVILSATELHSMGRRTNELTLGLAVSQRPGAAARDGLYLLQAFNSSRLFAWIERTFFNTPYDLGRLDFSDRPARVALTDSAGAIANLQMGPAAAPALEQPEMWQGAIYLPGGRTFTARLGGQTEIYPFVTGSSLLHLAPRERYPAIQWLLDSGLTPREWHIRHDAVHARSRTYTRPR